MNNGPLRLSLPSCAAAIVALWMAWPAAGQTSPISAQQFYNSVRANPNLNQEAGEGWAWHANHSMGHFMMAYQAWNDPSWLDYGVQYYDYALDQMRTGPDGYLGWIGPHIGGTPNRRQDTHMGDAILFRHMLEFAEIVHNNPSLQAAYGAKAQQYVELAKVHLFEKWDARGTYHSDGTYGAYRVWGQYTPENLSAWIHDPALEGPAITQQFNKQNAMAINALRIYRITGEEQYRERAIEIFSLAKSRMQHHDETYVWNFREPFMVDDVTSIQNNTVRTWINVHPNNASYQATEVSQIVEAYLSGIVFDEQDIQRLINTNLQVMWNGSTGSPQYVGPNTQINPGSTAPGTLWSALAHFDQTIRDLRRFGSDNRGRIERAYFENVIAASAPGFERTLAGDDEVSIFDFPHGNTRSLNMAFVTHSRFIAGEEQTIIGIRSLRSGQLSVALYDAEGAELILQLENRFLSGSTGGRGGLYLFVWDGTDAAGDPLAPGDYRIRWSLAGEGFREYPITLVPEPASLGLLGMAAVGLLGRRRRRMTR